MSSGSGGGGTTTAAAATSTTPDSKPKSSSRNNKPPRKQQSNVSDNNTSTTTTSDYFQGDQVLQSIAAKSNILLHPQVTLTVYIPTQKVGAVIGRRGSTIVQIQKQAQQVATATTSNNNKSSSSSAPVRVSIVGHEDAPDHAASRAARAGGGARTETTSGGEDPQQQQQGPSSPSAPASNPSSSSVPYTYSELDWSSPHWTPVVIRAEPCAALIAATKLSHLVEGDIDEVVLDLPLSKLKHPSLVGKRGMVLAYTSADTQVRIMVPPRNVPHDVIQLEGALNHVKICLEKVLTLASSSSSSENKRDSKQKKSSNTTTAASSSDQQQQVQETLVVSVLPSQTKLRNVGRKTETMIKKKRLAGGGDVWQLAVIGSTNEQVQAAVALLEKWIEKDNTGSSSSTPTTRNAPVRSSSSSSNRGGRGSQRNKGGDKNTPNKKKGPRGGSGTTSAPPTTPTSPEPNSS